MNGQSCDSECCQNCNSRLSSDEEGGRKLKTEVRKQFSVFLVNEPGTLAGLTSLLGEHGVNIFALTLTGGIDHGYVRMVVDDHELARRLLNEAGYVFFEKDVVLVILPNRAGALAAVSRLWFKNGINIEYVYCAGVPDIEEGLVVFGVDQVEKAATLARGAALE